MNEMIWFFLMGMVAGVVGAVMFAEWWVRKHAVPIEKVELNPEVIMEAVNEMNFEEYKKFMERWNEIDKQKRGENT